MTNFIKRCLKFNAKKPERIFWWLPLICNLNCNHCSIGKKTKIHGNKTEKLSLSDKKKIIDNLSQWIGKEYSLSFIAGEPLLHSDMIDILTYAKSKFAITSITSNGTLILNEKKAEEIVKSGLNYIALSMDGWKSGIHDASRGADGVLNKVIKAVKYLKLAKQKLNSETPNIFINSIIMKENLDDLIKIIDWVNDEKLDGITFQPIAANEFFGGDKAYVDNWFKSSNLWPNFDEVLSFIDYLENKKRLGYPIINSENDFRRFKKYFKDPINFASTETCESELKSMVITENGDVKICPGLNENFGNILTDDLDKMWHSLVAWKARIHVYSCKSQCKILANTKEDFYF